MRRIRGDWVGLTLSGLIVGTLAMSSWSDVAWVGAGMLVTVLITPKMNYREFGRRLRPFAFFAGVTLIFGAAGSGDAFLTLGPFHWTYSALERAGIAAARILLLGGAFGWMMLVVGTPPLLQAAWRAGGWLRRFGLNVDPILVALAVAMRFLPMVQDEAVRLRLAWDAKGADLLGHGPIGRIRYMSGLVVPLLASALRRAEQFAAAVELRGVAAKGKALASTFRSERERGATSPPRAARIWTSLVAPLAGWAPVLAKIWLARGGQL